MLCYGETQRVNKVGPIQLPGGLHSSYWHRLIKQQKTFSVFPQLDINTRGVGRIRDSYAWKPETKSRVCITVENSPNASSVHIKLWKHGKRFLTQQNTAKKVFYCFYKITFPRRKTLCMALIKREILTSRKILSTKSCTRNQFLFCKKMLCKIRFFLA